MLCACPAPGGVGMCLVKQAPVSEAGTMVAVFSSPGFLELQRTVHWKVTRDHEKVCGCLQEFANFPFIFSERLTRAGIS